PATDPGRSTGPAPGRLREPQAGAVDRSQPGPAGGAGRDRRGWLPRFRRRSGAARAEARAGRPPGVAVAPDRGAVAHRPDGRPPSVRLRGPEEHRRRASIGLGVVDLSVVVPCYNEELRLARSLTPVERF